MSDIILKINSVAELEDDYFLKVIFGIILWEGIFFILKIKEKNKEKSDQQKNVKLK